MTEIIILRFDGLYMSIPRQGRPGPQAGFMCYGWIISRGSKMLGRGHGGYVRGQDASSNVAEYLALIDGLEALRDMGADHEPIRVIGDARTVIDQMQGYAQVSAESIREIYQRTRRLANYFSALEWEWTPRRHNREADALTRRALHQIQAHPDSYQDALEEILLGHAPQRRFAAPVLDLRIYQPQSLPL